MRILIIPICFYLLIGITYLHAQENYSNLVDKAYNLSQDSLKTSDALHTYNDAFKKFPDSINRSHLYQSSLMALKLKDLDAAFRYMVDIVKYDDAFSQWPGWYYILNFYDEKDYPILKSRREWLNLNQIAEKNKVLFYQDLEKQKKEFLNVRTQDFNAIHNPENLYQKIKESPTYLLKQRQDYILQFQINDTAITNYHVHLPNKYNPKKKYPLLFFLHGAVRHNKIRDFIMPEGNLKYWNRYYTKYAALHEVILVFPIGGKNFNWMLPDLGFDMIPKMLNEIKTGINVDDNKVFISGHSNGATGSFSYAMKNPSAFAGFYGFNTYPLVFTGGTFIENILNRSFINFSTDQDYYYPPEANDKMTSLMDSIHADYKEFRYKGFPHWFPEFDESEPAYQILFEDLIKRERNPFPSHITWEFDDNKYGKMDWVGEMKLDTLLMKKPWHKTLNFNINKWLSYDEKDSLITKSVDKKAFNFPRKSGKLLGDYHNNIFKIETSRIQSFRIYISSEMVNLDKNVVVYVNDKLYYNGKVEYNRDFILNNFNKFHDRKQLWINYIDIALDEPIK